MATLKETEDTAGVCSCVASCGWPLHGRDASRLELSNTGASPRPEPLAAKSVVVPQGLDLSSNLIAEDTDAVAVAVGSKVTGSGLGDVPIEVDESAEKRGDATREKAESETSLLIEPSRPVDGFVSMTQEEFLRWRAPIPDFALAHVVGWESCIALESFVDVALSTLEDASILSWDGSPLHETGFTAVVPRFLQRSPFNIVLTFRAERAAVNGLWTELTSQHPGRCCEVVMRSDATHEDWLQTARPGKIVALGGGSKEVRLASARASEQNWHVLALSRGKQEIEPSLMNLAKDTPTLQLLTQLDPRESLCYALAQTEAEAGGMSEQLSISAKARKSIRTVMSSVSPSAARKCCRRRAQQ